MSEYESRAAVVAPGHERRLLYQRTACRLFSFETYAGKRASRMQEVTMTAASAVCPGRSTGLSAIGGGTRCSLAAGTLSTARIAMLTGVTEVHHG